jgi:hypothetical protein
MSVYVVLNLLNESSENDKKRGSAEFLSLSDDVFNKFNTT